MFFTLPPPSYLISRAVRNKKQKQNQLPNFITQSQFSKPFLDIMIVPRAKGLNFVFMVMAFVCCSWARTSEAASSSIMMGQQHDHHHTAEDNHGTAAGSTSAAAVHHYTRRRLQNETLTVQPSASPTLGIQRITSAFLAMDIEGLSLDDMVGSRAQDHWRTTTSQYIQSYWESNNAQQQSFPLVSVSIFIESKEVILDDASSSLTGGIDDVGGARGLRILYTLEFEVRSGSNSNISIPNSIYSFPVTQAYINSLKVDDPTPLGVFGKVSNVINLGVFREKEETSYPSLSPSSSPSSLPPTVDQLHNAKSYTMNVVIDILITVTIILGMFTIFVMWKYLSKGNKTCRKNGPRYTRGENANNGLDETRFPVTLNNAGDDAPNFS
jgi:hypothetical protein